MTDLDSLLKSRNLTLPIKIHIVKALFFPVIIYGCESWTMKKTVHWRFYTFKWWYWRRLLRVPWTARRSNRSILQEINPEYSLGGLMIRPLDGKNTLIGKEPDTGKDWKQKEKQTVENEIVRRHHLLNGYEFEQAPGDSGGQGSLVVCSSWAHKELDTTYWLNNNNWNQRVLLFPSFSKILFGHNWVLIKNFICFTV